MSGAPNDYEDYDDFNEYDLPACPHCQGSGEVNCLCGGDFCVCENYGEKDCPVCHGEGEVTEERYDRYMDNLRKQREMLATLLKEQP
jgi:RecJ-like exonuclease